MHALTHRPRGVPCADLVYPPVWLALDLLAIDYPDARFKELEQPLLDLGIDDVWKVFRMQVDVLEEIVGCERVERLQLYAGYGVSPIALAQRLGPALDAKFTALEDELDQPTDDEFKYEDDSGSEDSQDGSKEQDELYDD